MCMCVCVGVSVFCNHGNWEILTLSLHLTLPFVLDPSSPTHSPIPSCLKAFLPHFFFAALLLDTSKLCSLFLLLGSPPPFLLQYPIISIFFLLTSSLLHRISPTHSHSSFIILVCLPFPSLALLPLTLCFSPFFLLRAEGISHLFK